MKLSQDKRNEIFLFANGFTNLTMNGEPAKVSGRLLDFPIVSQINGPFQAKFSWEAVKRICEGGGDFEV